MLRNLCVACGPTAGRGALVRPSNSALSGMSLDLGMRMPGPTQCRRTRPSARRARSRPSRRGASSPARCWCRSRSRRRSGSIAGSIRLRFPPRTGWVIGVAALVVWLVARFRSAASAAVWLWVGRRGTRARRTTTPTGTRSPPTTSPLRDGCTDAGARSRHARRGTGCAPRPEARPARDRAEERRRRRAVLAVTAIETATGGRRHRARRGSRSRADSRPARGDVVEVAGRLSTPHAPANPGERDYRSQLLDHRITAVVRVENSAATVTRTRGGLANVAVRLARRAPRLGHAGVSGVAAGRRIRVWRAALLLGDTHRARPRGVGRVRPHRRRSRAGDLRAAPRHSRPGSCGSCSEGARRAHGGTGRGW